MISLAAPWRSPTIAVFSAILCTLNSGCSGEPQLNTAQEPITAESPTPNISGPRPTDKDVIRVLVASADVPLKVDPSCLNAGTEFSDETIGDYISGLLALLNEKDARNWIETTVDEQVRASGETVWVSRVMISHAQDEDVWQWGVEFTIRSIDNNLTADSFRCLGAG